MFRFPYLFDLLTWELMAVAEAMEDGSYWEEDNPFYTDNYTVEG